MVSKGLYYKSFHSELYQSFVIVFQQGILSKKFFCIFFNIFVSLFHVLAKSNFSSPFSSTS